MRLRARRKEYTHTKSEVRPLLGLFLFCNLYFYSPSVCPTYLASFLIPQR